MFEFALYNLLDYVLAAIVIVSFCFGLARGFVREVISLSAWILAFVLAINFNQDGTVFFEQYIKTPYLSNIVSFLCIFLGTLIVGALVSSALSSICRGVGLSISNSILGGMFGILRGILIVLFVSLLFTATALNTAMWVQNSQIMKNLGGADVWLKARILETGIVKGNVSLPTKDQTVTFFQQKKDQTTSFFKKQRETGQTLY